jgi:cell wall-associated NlpC family hydrolase
VNRRAFLATGTVLVGAALYGGKTATAGTGKAPSVPARAAVTAVAYARAQVGQPYEWGGDGPAYGQGFDCSGLVMMAYRAAGIGLPRTSQEQWDQLPHIRKGQLQSGDLVFYAGADGTQTSPGHVVMFTGNGNVVQAYATGYPVMITPLASVDAGLLTGYARPWT